ncbi:aspartyl-phosphate phosphatase Spo0E family protein [Hazenella sp. IB182357]|uniref:Aspartyl-phosphate phosphatase Spo0E family protein n=1 Tax=Polycladospora coralii TaxID=2771432 RepID=A0A926N8S2_9BACL|nr:aspartyl-phosphate phosphatase Spo0E family protein [Polycladospora coralii]MBD1370900.1 aspartyl-phosphate phosphatase Spo0E family protein [Polycladospora coralii]MBS7529839.1 aspartyl-phosphate phosphatase Spo0E family protein [Polycladospora coralii]
MDLEEQIEGLRMEMEDTAMRLGLGHPKVYQLSLELDRLHNLWEKEKQGQVCLYAFGTHDSKIKEPAVGEWVHLMVVVSEAKSPVY